MITEGKAKEIMNAVRRYINQDEMQVFEQLKKEYPVLEKLEQKVSSQLISHHKLIIDLVINAHDGVLYSHSFVINGALLRSLNFYRGAIWALANRNPHVFFDSLRAQCETLSLAYYCVKHPEYIVPATIGKREHPDETLKIKNVLTMVDIANRKYRGLREDFDSLCELVHPNPSSLYANIQPKTETEKGSLLIRVATKSPRVTEEEAEKYLNMLIIWTDWIFDELIEIAKYFKETVKE
jgi:hypothetical protein